MQQVHVTCDELWRGVEEGLMWLRARSRVWKINKQRKVEQVTWLETCSKAETDLVDCFEVLRTSWRGLDWMKKTGRMWLRERNRVWEINKQIKVEPVTWLNQANPTSGCSLSKRSDTKEKKGARWLSSRWRKRTRKKVGWKKVQPCHLTCLGQSSLE
jgi:hypothetical protein